MTDLITPVFQAFVQAPSEGEIIGTLHPLDIGQPWIGRDTYKIYWAIGRAFKPESYLEIGVRFGHSILAVAKGSGTLKTAYGFDNELDITNGLKFADVKIRPFVADLHLTKADTQTLTALEVPPVDIAHVDGMHTYDGVRHDCELAWAALKPGGLMLIDDVGGNSDIQVRLGADRFCADHGLAPQYLPCLAGMYLVKKP